MNQNNQQPGSADLDFDKLQAIVDRVDADGLFNTSGELREWIASARDAIAASRRAVQPPAYLDSLLSTSIRDYPDFTEDVERLSEPGLAKKQAKIIRKAIYDVIDARVRNSIVAAQIACEKASPASLPDVAMPEPINECPHEFRKWDLKREDYDPKTRKPFAAQPAEGSAQVAWDYALMGLPNEEIAAMWRACGHSGIVPFSFASRIQERSHEVATSAAVVLAAPAGWARKRNGGGYGNWLFQTQKGAEQHGTAGDGYTVVALYEDAAEGATPAGDAEDAARLDWLGQNFFSDQKDDWDERLRPDAIKWKFFGPMGVQGDIRLVIDAARIDGDKQAEQGEKA